jgi:hypothetical protein
MLNSTVRSFVAVDDRKEKYIVVVCTVLHIDLLTPNTTSYGAMALAIDSFPCALASSFQCPLPCLVQSSPILAVAVAAAVFIVVAAYV